MHLKRLCAFTAIATVTTMSVALAQATQVTIIDPTATTRAARVEPGSRLAVQEVAPSSFFHASAFTVTSSTACRVVAAPPSGKALVVRQVRVNVYSVATPGVNNAVEIFPNGTCDGDAVASVNPATIGVVPLTFDPGLSIASGGALSVHIFGSPQAELYTDGFIAAPAAVPALGQVVQVYGKPGQR